MLILSRPRGAALLAACALVLAAVTGLTGLTGLTGPEPAAHAATNTIVTLGFDDGLKNQFTNARPILRSHNMHATFYVNSGQTNLANYMTQADLTALAADGDEIGGHTVDHANLTTVVSDDAAREVCNDRVTLSNWGFTVKNFAYPFGDFDPQAQQIVQNCGYNSARAVGGIVSPGMCGGCDFAESIPPNELYAMQTPDSIKAETTLNTIKGYVTQAESHGGGWVQLVLHHVCDNCTDVYRTSPSLLDAFLDWLAPRAANGTVVKTVDQVIGGPTRPLVNGPALNPPTSGNLVYNPSLESASSGLPTCFQFGGYGTNTFAWAQSTDAHTGSFAQRLEISGFTSGDRKLVTKQDANTCAPVATPNHTYTASIWYKGNWAAGVEVKLTLYYRTSAGTWVYWTSGKAVPASGTWVKTPAFTSPPAPAGATGLSIGLSLAGVGTIYTDDYEITDTANP